MTPKDVMLISANGSTCIAMTSAWHRVPRHRQQHGQQDQPACFLQSHSQLPQSRIRGNHAGRRLPLTRAALEEADWEEEMSLFRKRLQKPNQLETLRKIVEEVDIGKVRQTKLCLGSCLSLPLLHAAFPGDMCMSPCRCCWSATALQSSRA